MYDVAIALSSKCSSWEPVITNAKALKKKLPCISLNSYCCSRLVGNATFFRLKNVSSIPSYKRHAKPLA